MPKQNGILTCCSCLPLILGDLPAFNIVPSLRNIRLPKDKFLLLLSIAKSPTSWTVPGIYLMNDVFFLNEWTRELILWISPNSHLDGQMHFGSSVYSRLLDLRPLLFYVGQFHVLQSWVQSVRWATPGILRHSLLSTFLSHLKLTGKRVRQDTLKDQTSIL